MEADTGTVLHEQNADARLLIASTTKIMTALVVLERCGVDELVIIPDGFQAVEGSSMYLKPGERLSVRDLLYGLMLASGNDAAVALAQYVSGSVASFAELMNNKARALGCQNTHFVNPHGLDADDHYATARDLALITRTAMQNADFCEIAGTKSITVAGRTLKNHNKLLWTDPDVCGGKTGYTSSAGRSLVTFAERDGMQLICVTLSAPDDWDDHRALYAWGYDSFGVVPVKAPTDGSLAAIPVITGVSDTVDIKPKPEFMYVYSKCDTIDVRWNVPHFVYAPIEKGARAGSVVIHKNGQPDVTVALVYGDTVALDKSQLLTPWERLGRLLRGYK